MRATHSSFDVPRCKILPERSLANEDNVEPRRSGFVGE